MEYLKTVIAGITEYPDEVQVSESHDHMGVLLTVTVAQTDMGKILGRGGATARAIRALMTCHGFLNKQRISVKILNPYGLPSEGLHEELEPETV